MANKGKDGGGLEALHRLKETEPPLYLTPSSDLSFSSRTASEFLFSSLKPYTPKSPFDQLLTNGFDAEQIWQQIDLQSQPLISSLRREIKRFEKDPVRISKGFDAFVRKVGSGPQNVGVADMEQDDDDSESNEFEEEEEEEEDDDDDDEEEEEEKEDVLEESGEDDEMEENAMEEESEDDGSEEEKEGPSVVEDKFLKIKELEKYLKEDEEREYGLKTEPKAGSKKTSKKDSDDDEEDEDDDEEDEDDQLGLFEEGDEDEDEELANARYEDFYVSNNKKSKKIHKQKEVSDDSGAEDEQEDNEKEKKLSRHEIEQKKIQAKIAEMEKANLDPRTWTMQGEVTAAKRPLNSALEADLDFEHNVRPPPIITEEVTVSIEEIIKKRINEGRFDGVQRAPKLSSKAPREYKELDESKSKKGLADIYEEEYLEKTGLAPASLSFSDELKKEASVLFKRLTLKLNALSHFHFAPKPVVEDMAVETNLPALAMEEVAPVAVSDAAMLAPEEVFAGVGDVKEEAELTQEERKRRRAKKKRKFKAEQTKRMAKKPRETPVISQGEGKVAVIKA
ncbi:hypothetical protein V2J09_006821 [Rumex salicifolius]